MPGKSPQSIPAQNREYPGLCCLLVTHRECPLGPMLLKSPSFNKSVPLLASLRICERDQDRPLTGIGMTASPHREHRFESIIFLSRFRKQLTRAFSYAWGESGARLQTNNNAL